MTCSDLDAVKEKYPVSPDVEKMNAKGNPAIKVIDNPAKLRKLQKAVGIKESEDNFLSWIIEYAHLRGWLCAHFRPAKVIHNGKETWRTAVSADGKGFPDLVMARRGIVIFAEAKSADGLISPEQIAWNKELNGEGYFTKAFIWRPQDRDSVIDILT